MKYFFRIIIFLLAATNVEAQFIPSGGTQLNVPTDEEILRMMTPQSERFLLTSTGDQARAMRMNPATIGDYASVNAAYDVYVEGGRMCEHEILFQNYLFNCGWRRALSYDMRYKVDQINLSMGFKQPFLQAGLSLNWMTTDLPKSKSSTMWNFAMMFIPDTQTRIVITKRNVNQPTFDDVQLRGIQSIGIGIWPFIDREQLSFGLDYTWPNRVRMADGGTRFGADAKIFKFFRIYALYEFTPIFHDRMAMVGIRLFLPYSGVNVGDISDSFQKNIGTEGSFLIATEKDILK